ncbi:MAG: diguanylate cyclase [Candidatus Limnocylindrales bacterium]
MTRLESIRPRGRRVIRHLAADQHVVLAVAVVLAALVIELAARAGPGAVLAPSLVYLPVQMVVAFQPRIARTRSGQSGRLLFALAAVCWINVNSGDPGALPLATLYLPIVAMAAALGTRPGLLLGSAALVAYFVPVLAVTTSVPGLLQRGVALAATMLLVGIGTRRTVSSLERAVASARAATNGQRRRSRQMAAIEQIGRLLATKGPSTAALDEVVEILVGLFEYRYVSIYLADRDRMVLRAQRGYDDVIESFDGSAGIVGRIMRTREAVLVRDVLADADYRAASPDVRSEVSVPLLAGDELVGVLNVESGQDDRALDQSDCDMMVVVADRIAASLALASERLALERRAALFTRLATFGTAVNASLDLTTAHTAVADAVAVALDCDVATLVLRDPATGDDRIAALHGGDSRYIGVRIPPGEGLSGRAMRGSTIVRDVLSRDEYPSTVQGAETHDVLAAAAMPLIHEGVVIGAISLGRQDLARPFTSLELEAMPLIGSQAALALANVSLHARVADAATRDPLTGLWNRRHLEVSLERLFAVRSRLDPASRHPVAAIMFDLDHFGRFNKRHGHLVGDAILRAFGAILTGRLRSSDIVARFGGEEFVAILDGATVAEAQRVADEIRRALEAVRITGADGTQLTVTVSAGCASLGPDVTSIETLLEVADVGLQMAKRGGRNQVVAA